MNETLEDQLRKKIESLGNSPVAIRSLLFNQRITGNKGQSRSCPIAMFLKKEGFICPSVSQIFIAVGNDEFYADINTPEAVAQFLQRFDTEEYPELINDN